jgi:hypothetical protein
MRTAIRKNKVGHSDIVIQNEEDNNQKINEKKVSNQISIESKKPSCESTLLDEYTQKVSYISEVNKIQLII